MIQEDDLLPRATEPPFCQHFMRRTTQHALLAINLASQQKTTQLYFFFSGKETVQTFSDSIEAITLLFAK